MRFVDEVEITLASGHGGSGLLSFRRAKYVPRGGPDGGDGGRGGALVLEATRERNTLVDLRWHRTYRAEDGKPGGDNNMTGHDGRDLVIHVPVGTEVWGQESGELLADLATEGARFVLPGGRGGHGNLWFKSSTNRTPTQFQEGEEGVEIAVRLELKLLADVGLLGVPNAGKSTLISRISRATPKVSDYPFTTLVPNLGVVSVDDGRSFVVADIPGLVEGAAEGRGLGHRFLKHVERCHLLVHLVPCDATYGAPEVTWRLLRDELAAYDPELARRPEIVVLSKVDLLPPEERAAVAARLEATTGQPVLQISAATNEGLRPLIMKCWSMLGRPDGDDDDS